MFEAGEGGIPQAVAEIKIAPPPEGLKPVEDTQPAPVIDDRPEVTVPLPPTEPTPDTEIPQEPHSSTPPSPDLDTPPDAPPATDRTSETVEMKLEVGQMADKMIEYVQTKYGLDPNKPEQWGTLLEGKTLTAPLKKALATQAKILQTNQAITKAKETRDRLRDAPPSSDPAAVAPTIETDDQILARFGKDRDQIYGQYYEVDANGNPLDPPRTLFMGETYKAYVEELSKADTLPEQKLAKELKSMMTRDINRPDVYIFDASKGKETKTEYDMYHDAVDVVTTLVGDQILTSGSLNKEAMDKALTEKKIKPNQKVGKLANLLVWYHEAQNNPQVRQNLSALIYDEMKTLDPKDLARISGTEARFQPVATKLVRFQTNYAGDTEFNDTHTLFKNRLSALDQKITTIIQTQCGRETAANVASNLVENRSKVFAVLMSAHAIEGSSFLQRDPSNNLISPKPEFVAQFNTFVNEAGLTNVRQLLLDVAAHPNTAAGILSETIGVNPNEYQDGEMLVEQARKAADLIAKRTSTDTDSLLPQLLAGDAPEMLMNPTMQKAFEQMLLLNMGSGLKIDEEKMRKAMAQIGKSGMIGLIMLWGNLMDVLNTDADSLAGGGGQRRH